MDVFISSDIGNQDHTLPARASFWLRWLRQPQTIIGGTLFLIIVITAVFGPSWTPQVTPNTKISIYLTDLSPSLSRFPLRLFGLWGFYQGKSVFVGTVWGARSALKVGLTATLVTTLMGVVIGAASGYLRGWPAMLLTRFTDLIATFPPLPLVITLLTLGNPSLSLWNIAILFGLVGWVPLARVVQASLLSLREQEFVTAARATGVSTFRILWRHLAPNILHVVLATSAFSFAGFIIAQSTLEYLRNTDIQYPPVKIPGWGDIIAFGKQYIDSYWWIAVFPGLALLVTTVSLVLIGEGFQRAIDTRANLAGGQH